MVVLNRKDYYSQSYILLEIVKQLKYRYLSIRRINNNDPKKNVLSRYYQGYSLPTIKDSLFRNNVLNDITAKIYFDLSTWKDERDYTPIFSFDSKQRKIDKKEFSGNPTKNDGDYINLIKSYDFAIDIDCKDLKKAWKEAKKVKEILDNYKLPYSLRFSGTKGFHFVIDARYIKIKVNPIKLPEIFGKVVNELIKDENLKYIDTSIYDPRRILKLAYSLCNNDGKEYVCLPLSDYEFDNWKYEDMELLKVMKRIKIKERGLLERNFNLTEKQLNDNVLKFMKEYGYTSIA